MWFFGRGRVVGWSVVGSKPTRCVSRAAGTFAVAVEQLTGVDLLPRGSAWM